MKKVFLTAVAVVAFSFTGNAKQNQELIFTSCFQIAIDTYDAVLASSGSMRLASIAADAAYDSCNQH
jgi:hypothetical protein